MQKGEITLGERLSTSVGRKLVVALTGLFLSLFLVVHLIGNLQLLKNDGGQAFNQYAEFMGHNPLIQIISKVNFIIILGHAFYGIYLAVKNRGARPSRYMVNKQSVHTSFASRNMALLGTIIFVFIAIHLSNFYFKYHFGDVKMVEYHDIATGEMLKVKDYASVVYTGFAQVWIVVFYVIAMLALALHLSHGLQSGLQTMGLSSKESSSTIKLVGNILAYGICLLFAVIPVIIFLNQPH